MVDSILDHAINCSDSERGACVTMTMKLVEAKKLSAEDVERGFEEMWEFLVDLKIDIPKAFTNFAQLAAPLIGAGAMTGDVLLKGLEKVADASKEAPKELLETILKEASEGGEGEGDRVKEKFSDERFSAILSS
jgi:hypothetical protein